MVTVSISMRGACPDEAIDRGENQRAAPPLPGRKTPFDRIGPKKL